MTDELKKALESAHTDEEKKAVAEKFKDELKKLSDEKLEGVTGGGLEFGTSVNNGGYKTQKQQEK